MAYGDLHKLLPWAVAGFTFNAISGMVFFVAQPQTYTLNLSFDLNIIVSYWRASRGCTTRFSMHPGRSRATSMRR